MTKKTSNRFSPEVRQRAVRLVPENGGDHASHWAAIGSVAGKIGCTDDTQRRKS
jgi:transposase-like protein